MAEITTNEKLTTVKQLVDTTKLIAENTAKKTEVAAVNKRIDDLALEAGAGEMNKIDIVKVNGTAVQISDSDKSVDIEVPESIDDLDDAERITTLETQITQKADSSALDEKADKDELENYVKKDGLESELSESDTISGINTSLDNKLENITINGVSVSKENTTVNLTMDNIDTSREYKKWAEIQTLVDGMIVKTKHARYQIVDKLPDPESEAEENVMYLLKTEGKKGYDIYILEDGDGTPTLRQVDDTTADLEGYAKSADVAEEIIQKLTGYTPTEQLESTVTGYGFAKTTDIDQKYGYDSTARKTLSQENFTTELKTKLQGIATDATKVEVGDNKDGKITINGSEKTVYELPGDVVRTSDIQNFVSKELIATDEEVEALIKEIFGTDDDASPSLAVASDKEVSAAVSNVFSDN